MSDSVITMQLDDDYPDIFSTPSGHCVDICGIREARLETPARYQR